MLMVLLMIWDGFHLIGEGFGLRTRKADRFADVLWLASAAVTGTWLAGLSLLAIG